MSIAWGPILQLLPPGPVSPAPSPLFHGLHARSAFSPSRAPGIVRDKDVKDIDDEDGHRL